MVVEESKRISRNIYSGVVFIHFLQHPAIGCAGVFAIVVHVWLYEVDLYQLKESANEQILALFGAVFNDYS